ncbi:hypothetical protein [Micromonospora sp. KC207]|uniref:hypothetical protein n=1 Tax=Micromonospora sp. KC207 TaxID=2530377 RepID=UPI001404B86E|nr:hypothetical protein [Micromonospora sp. KC207]
MSIFHDARKSAQPPTSSDRPTLPYDWASRPPTEDTDAAAADVLRNASKPKR